MEAKGRINQYQPYKTTGKSWYTINLADGVTPFMKMFENKEHQSMCYRLEPRPASLTVTHAWYRPTKEEFDLMHPMWHDHILNGGLAFAELGAARQLPDDPVEVTWEYERFQEWCLKYYGKRRGPLE